MNEIVTVRPLQLSCHRVSNININTIWIDMEDEEEGERVARTIESHRHADRALKWC